MSPKLVAPLIWLACCVLLLFVVFVFARVEAAEVYGVSSLSEERTGVEWLIVWLRLGVLVGLGTWALVLRKRERERVDYVASEVGRAELSAFRVVEEEGVEGAGWERSQECSAGSSARKEASGYSRNPLDLRQEIEGLKRQEALLEVVRKGAESSLEWVAVLGTGALGVMGLVMADSGSMVGAVLCWLVGAGVFSWGYLGKGRRVERDASVAVSKRLMDVRGMRVAAQKRWEWYRVGRKEWLRGRVLQWGVFRERRRRFWVVVWRIGVGVLLLAAVVLLVVVLVKMPDAPKRRW